MTGAWTQVVVAAAAVAVVVVVAAAVGIGIGNGCSSKRRSSPWYASVSQELRSAKRQRRRAERKWLKTSLTVDKQIYGADKRAVTNIVHKANSDYFSSQIAQSNCSKVRCL